MKDKITITFQKTKINDVYIGRECKHCDFFKLKCPIDVCELGHVYRQIEVKYE